MLPTIILPGYLAGALPYGEMEQSLRQLGGELGDKLDGAVRVVPLRRRDWLPTLGGRSVRPILQLLDQTVKQLQAETGSEAVNLVGHSAGGWICRIYLGEVPYDIHPSDSGQVCLWKAHPTVNTLITLGTPHVSNERWTKRNLDFVKTHYPGAFHSKVHYVCVAGKAAYGSRRNWFTYSSYEMTGGQGACWGDGITPIEAAHLDGAENLTLDQVWHSPRPGRLWYGSPSVVSQWAKYLG